MPATIVIEVTQNNHSAVFDQVSKNPTGKDNFKGLLETNLFAAANKPQEKIEESTPKQVANNKNKDDAGNLYQDTPKKNKNNNVEPQRATKQHKNNGNDATNLDETTDNKDAQVEDPSLLGQLPILNYTHTKNIDFTEIQLKEGLPQLQPQTSDNHSFMDYNNTIQIELDYINKN